MTSDIDKVRNILAVTRLQLSHALARAAEMEAENLELKQEFGVKNDG